MRRVECHSMGARGRVLQIAACGLLLRVHVCVGPSIEIAIDVSRFVDLGKQPTTPLHGARRARAREVN